MSNSDAACFSGFAREVGRAGVRNYLLVLSATGLTGPTARRIGAQVAGAKVICNPVDTGLLGADRAATDRALRGFISHPNVGAVLIIGGNVPRVAALSEYAASMRRTVEAVTLDACDHDALTLTDRGVRAAAGMARSLSRQRRTPQALADLLFGLECGRSDPSSGLVSNPLLGRMADRLVDHGGSAIIGETTEWLGAEHLLAARAVNEGVAQDILDAVLRKEQMAIDAGLDLLGNNPAPTNIAAGLSTIEEKSLGNITKSGHRPIQSVLAYGEAPSVAGLHVMDAPAYAPESLTGFTVAGAQLQFFTTGVGNSFVSLLAPTIKVSANPHTLARISEQIDFDASAAFDGTQSHQQLAHRLWATAMDVAEGSATWGEVLGEGEEVIARFAAAL
ncbi:MAG: altronate dehydratase large subunit [Gammaproteobacteria bacterium]|jgi:altronate dehydratase large subunit